MIYANKMNKNKNIHLNKLADYIKMLAFPDLLYVFLNNQLEGESGSDSDSNSGLLQAISPISVYHSTIALFYAPSDPSGICGMRHEHIQSTPSWRNAGPRHDCAFFVEKQDECGF